MTLEKPEHYFVVELNRDGVELGTLRFETRKDAEEFARFWLSGNHDHGYIYEVHKELIFNSPS